MRKYYLFKAISIFMFLMGFFTISMVEKHAGLLVLVVAAFWGYKGYNDLANSQLAMLQDIADEASMDRPE